MVQRRELAAGPAAAHFTGSVFQLNRWAQPPGHLCGVGVAAQLAHQGATFPFSIALIGYYWTADRQSPQQLQ
jgi:hypothetical protein